MQFDTATAPRAIDKVLGEIGQRLKPGSYNDTRFVGTYTQAREDAVRARAVIERLTSPGSTYRDQANEIGAQKVPQDHKVLDLVGVLRALRKDLDDGYTRTIEELIHADVFADFLEMASELVDKNYKDPAAVIAGSTLEEHLRSLAGRSGVAVESEDGKPRKADTLNADLVKAGVYNKLKQKGVTAWLGLRNDAAHGHYDNYDKSQVQALIRDVRAFIQRHGA